MKNINFLFPQLLLLTTGIQFHWSKVCAACILLRILFVHTEYVCLPACLYVCLFRIQWEGQSAHVLFSVRCSDQYDDIPL